MKLHNILQTEDIIKVSIGNTLSSVLSKLSSSHDAAFVFNEEKKYMGVVNPYYCLIKTSAPANAKVERCIQHAPHVKLKYPVAKIAQLMIESKIHYLPVFDDQEKFQGIVSARGLLGALEYANIFTEKINMLLSRRKRELVTINEDESLAVALHVFKVSKVSKLVVINKDRRLKGILSYYDLISFLASPKKRDRSDRSGDKVALQNKSVRHFAKTYVLTLNKNDYIRDALHLILEKKIGSVVIVDEHNVPIGIITTRDLLSLFIHENNKESIEITSKNLSPESKKIVGGFFGHLSLWLKKIPDMAKAKLFVKEEKEGGLFKVSLSLIPKKGEAKVIQEEGKDLHKVLNKVKKKEDK